MMGKYKMNNKKLALHSIEKSFEISRENKKLIANLNRMRQALSDLVAATSTAPSLTPEQQAALDKSIQALQYKV